MFKIDKVDEHVGVGLFASAPLLAETVILNEEPIISAQFSWSKTYGYLACDFCLKPLESVNQNVRRLTNDNSIDLPYPEFCPLITHPSKVEICENCQTVYCSNTCQARANELYHNLMCFSPKKDNPITELDQVWKMIHMPPETSAIILVLRIICLFLNSKTNPQAKEASDNLAVFKSEFSTNSNEYFHKLIGKKFDTERDSLLNGIREAIKYILQEKFGLINQIDQDNFLKECQVENLLDENGFCSILSLLGRNQQGISTSPLSKWRMAVEHKLLNESEDKFNQFQSQIDDLYERLDETVGQFLDSEGVGLYKTQHYLNHSCEPNCEIKFINFNNTLSLTALRDIEIGEELTISYLDECELECSTRRRQKFLLENYLFQCKCSKCLKSPPLDNESLSSDDEDSHYNMDCN